MTYGMSRLVESIHHGRQRPVNPIQTIPRLLVIWQRQELGYQRLWYWMSSLGIFGLQDQKGCLMASINFFKSMVFGYKVIIGNNSSYLKLRKVSQSFTQNNLAKSPMPYIPCVKADWFHCLTCPRQKSANCTLLERRHSLSVSRGQCIEQKETFYEQSVIKRISGWNQWKCICVTELDHLCLK